MLFWVKATSNAPSSSKSIMLTAIQGPIVDGSGIHNDGIHESFDG